MGENNKIIEVRHDENYYCFDWIFKLNCLCNNCLQSCYITSPRFTTKSILSHDWNLKLSNFLGDELLLTLFINGYCSFDDNCTLRISARKVNNLINYSSEYNQINVEFHTHGISADLNFINFSLINNCEYYTHEKVFTIVVEVFKPVKVIPPNIRNTITNLEKALKNLQLSEKLSDVTLVVGEREFRVHKAILAAHSSVFLAMFEVDMKETNESRVVIEDVSERVMEQVLDYIYGGTVEKENFGVLASEVLIAADKYNLQGLVPICEDAMIRSLNADNVLQMLTTIEVYKLNSLKKRALNFIVQNVKEVVESDEFKTFLDSSSYCLVKEIILAINDK